MLFSLQFICEISDMESVTMFDDKTLSLIMLNLDSSGKKLILTTLLWKQMSWKPPWDVMVMEMEEERQFSFGFKIKIAIWSR